MDQIFERQMQHAGIDVNELVDSLIRAAGLEFWAFYSYCAAVLKPLELGRGFKNVLEGTRIDHQTHFNDLLRQIRELGGMLPDDIRQFVRTTDLPHPALHSNSEAIAFLSALEQSLIGTYTAICDRTAGKDLRMYEFSLGILRSERDHLLRLEERARFIGESERLQSLINDYSRLTKETFRLDRRLTDEVSELTKSREDLYELLLPLSQGIDMSNLKVHRYVGMCLYLPKADPAWTEAISQELLIFVHELGFTVVYEAPPIKSSLFKRWIAKTKDFATQPEVADRLKKGERALELATLRTYQANVDKTLAEAAAKLLEALDQTPEAAVQIGSLVLLKHGTAEGKAKTLVRTLTQKELIFLEQNRELLHAPEDLIKRLSEVNESETERET